jgi:hypothetical protein
VAAFFVEPLLPDFAFATDLAVVLAPAAFFAGAVRFAAGFADASAAAAGASADASGVSAVVAAGSAAPSVVPP